MSHYEILSPREGKDKTYWMKIGAAFKRDKGGYSLKFDALPLTDKEGKISLLMVEPKPKNINGDQFKQAIDAATAGDLDDSVPF